MPTDVPFDNASAEREGWALVEAIPAYEQFPAAFLLQHIEPVAGKDGVFETDEDAWRHVVARARAGSELHRRALELVHPVERLLIEATVGSW